MERQRSPRGSKRENPRIDAFLDEIAQVCKKHGLSIYHEDGYGNFIVGEYDDDDVEVMNNALDGMK